MSDRRLSRESDGLGVLGNRHASFGSRVDGSVAHAREACSCAVSVENAMFHRQVESFLRPQDRKSRCAGQSSRQFSRCWLRNMLSPLRANRREGLQLWQRPDQPTTALPMPESHEMTTQRDYEQESRDGETKYAYGFDYDVMHPFMVRSFLPFFRAGNLLELGCYKGEFTRLVIKHFEDVTCVEASREALSEAESKLGGRAKLIHARFEDVQLPTLYDNILLTHVLEHLDDPTHLLQRINREWLSPKGRLFLVCPNANAPSRQIAVKMGLIPHNAAVTPSEAEHGHRRTYALDTLERDAHAAGLRVVHRSGIFFKALANFQWDQLLHTNIISREYLDGCYMLGQQYPDLCASIFLLCERGEG